MNRIQPPKGSRSIPSTATAAFLVLGALFGGCTSFAPKDSKQQGDTVDTEAESPADTADTGESTDTGEPEPTDELVVCYPGNGAEVCLPLVEYSASWGADYEYPSPYQGSAQYTPPVRFLDLSKVDPSLFLSENFVLEELMQEYKGRYGMFQVHALESLQAVREHTGGALYVNSGYRNVTYNHDVEGVPHSRHMFGDAVDMYSGVTTLQSLADSCGALSASYVGLYETHVHCDWRDHPLDPAFFDVDTGNAGPPPPNHTAEITRTRSFAFSAKATGFDEGEPLRQWRAFDADGQVLDAATARTYTPPPNAHSLEVVVGGQVVLTETLNK